MLLMLASWLALWDFEISFDATLLAFSEACPASPWCYPLETVALLNATLIFSWKLDLLGFTTPSCCYALGLLLGFPTRFCCYALSFLLGQSGKLLMLLSWPQHALNATLLGFFWNFHHALGVLYSLNYLVGFPTLSLCFVLGHASTLLSLRSWFFLERSFCFFLWRIKLQNALDATLLASSWNIPAHSIAHSWHSWCHVLGSSSDTLLMLRAEPSLWTVRDALVATVHHNRLNTLLTFLGTSNAALVGATLRLLTLWSGESHALGATLLALFWNTQARTL